MSHILRKTMRRDNCRTSCRTLSHATNNAKTASANVLRKKEKQINEKTMSSRASIVNRESVRVLAIELGAREAARRLGLNQNTVLSWAKRDNWELPNRKGGATKASANAITVQSKPGDVLIAAHKELEQRTRSGLAQATARAAEAAAKADKPVD